MSAYLSCGAKAKSLDESNEFQVRSASCRGTCRGKCRVKRKNVGEKLKKRRGKAGGNFLLFFYGGQLLNSSLVCQHAEFEDPLI